MDRDQAKALLQKYNRGEASPEEMMLLENWYALESQKQAADPLPEDFAAINKEIWGRIQSQRRKQVGAGEAGYGDGGSTRTIRLWPRIVAAASVLLAIGAGGYFFLGRPKPAASTGFACLIKNEIKPGHNQATLTLANGKKIILVKGLSGQLAVQHHTVVSANSKEITYTSSKQADQVSYNTLST